MKKIKEYVRKNSQEEFVQHLRWKNGEVDN